MSFAWTARDLVANTDHDHSYHDLIDARLVRVVTTDLGDMRRLAELLKGRPRLRARRVAVVVASDLAFGMARMYEAYREEAQGEHRIFRDYDQACQWLGMVERAAS